MREPERGKFDDLRRKALKSSAGEYGKMYSSISSVIPEWEDQGLITLTSSPTSNYYCANDFISTSKSV